MYRVWFTWNKKWHNSAKHAVSNRFLRHFFRTFSCSKEMTNGLRLCVFRSLILFMSPKNLFQLCKKKESFKSIYWHVRFIENSVWALGSLVSTTKLTSKRLEIWLFWPMLRQCLVGALPSPISLSRSFVVIFFPVLYFLFRFRSRSWWRAFLARTQTTSVVSKYGVAPMSLAVILHPSIYKHGWTRKQKTANRVELKRKRRYMIGNK